MIPVLTLFLARLVGGYAICFAAIGPKVTKGPWPRVSLFVIAGLSLAATAAGGNLWAGLGTAVGALLLERARLFGIPFLRSPIAILPFAAWTILAREPVPGFDTLLGGVAAGGTLAAMLLGHGYLTARGLSFDPLRILARALFVVLLLRAASVAPLFLGDAALQTGDWIYLSARVAFGLLLPLLFGWMVIECVKLQSNQSATGILYAMTALVGGGELIAAFLKVSEGIAA